MKFSKWGKYVTTKTSQTTLQKQRYVLNMIKNVSDKQTVVLRNPHIYVKSLHHDQLNRQEKVEVKVPRSVLVMIA